MARSQRLYASASGPTSFSHEGTTYTATNGVLDVPITAPQAAARGITDYNFTLGPLVGTTGERPTTAARSAPRTDLSRYYFDTTSNAMLVHNGNVWVNTANGLET